MKYLKPVKLYESLFKRSLRLKENPDLIPPLMAMNIDEDDVSFAHTLHCKTVTYLGTVRMNDNNMRPVLVCLQKLVSILKPKCLIVGYPTFDSIYKPNEKEINLTYLPYLCRHSKDNFYLQSNFNDSSLNILKTYLSYFRMDVAAAKLYGNYNIRWEDI
ncbi:hypothetical protein LWI28_009040 [Acer negundo]|uniref:Uncharacterized protein n=1 Tax=Acer negundo TaxID=4023 RepID=A0AAD5JH33_ACENE|nr:hypothetical protein LWI28_009040 [Acer negundo]